MGAKLSTYMRFFAKKMGMTHVFGNDGSLVPVTVMIIHDTVFIGGIASDPSRLLFATKSLRKPKNSSSSVKGVLSRAGLSTDLNKLFEANKYAFSSPLEVGKKVCPEDFMRIGDKVDISATSKGKGFAGTMKRYGYSGLRATHGVSVCHRRQGSTGQRQDPGKTFKNKGMPGRMGTDSVTIKGVSVVSISENLILLKGSVPGHTNSMASIVVKN